MNEGITGQAVENAEALTRIKELVDKCYLTKLAIDKAEAEYSKLKADLTEIMSSANIDKFIGEEATATCKLKTSVTVPKDIIGKRNVFAYIEKTYGKDVLEEMVTINAASFASWYNSEVEKNVLDGELDFNIEGVKPYEYFSVGFRKRAK